ncbi:AAA family ATPase [Methylophilus sp. TWE2]|uniref:AAA family ATPase n=1 Tax=Methylophilus sp. TWE2 TaxID=1662285 RepID=UPI0006710F73|nr:AAA family ATPase [Methylophilus sp. TWE2]AKR44327.1 hypothetical protein ACJ67_13595 [Methylophilus sp. TWE2]
MNDVNKDIMHWVQSQPFWVQNAVKIICTQAEINDSVINELLALLKTNEGQSNKNKIDLIGLLNSSSNADVDLRILSIGDIEGIDALAPRSPLPFSSNLSVVYGHNGSGKSGYARILKKICGKPNAADLLPNVFKGNPEKRQCTVVANVNGESKTFIWQANDKPINELMSVDVYDSQTGIFYIDKEQEVSYVPNEVALFETLVIIFQRLQQKLQLERDSIKTKLPTRPTQYGDSKYISAIYDRLKHDTNIATIESYFDFTEEDTKNLALSEERLSESPSELATKKHRRVAQMSQLLNQVKTAVMSVSEAAVKLLNALEDEAVQKRNMARQAAEAIEAETSFDGFGDDLWKAMWQAARKYSLQNAYPDAQFPNIEQGAKCVLCEQDLGSEAKTRLAKFENYVIGELESSATAAESMNQKALDNLPTKPNPNELETALQAAQLDLEKWRPIFTEIWAEIEKVVKNGKDKERTTRLHYDLPKDIFEEIERNITDINSEVEQHKKDAESFDKGSLQKQIMDLKAKKWASGYIQTIKDEIAELQRKHEIDEWLKSVNPRPVSLKAGQVSEIAVTDAFVGRFKAELKALGANRVSVELVKTRIELGRVKHKIQLQGLNTQHSRSKAISVLSEGEQRIVSMAAFLADVTSKPNSAPFIFDDPISSLDQTYEEYTAKRLVELSADRQVIVFTHRLSLLGQLIDKGNAEYRHIRRESWGSGEHGDLPLFAKKPINAVKDLKGSKLTAARKVFEESGYQSYYPLAKAICSDFRILLERVVEFELLADVVTRHRREVHTKGKLHKLAKITSEDCELIEELMGDFSCFEHSQSSESPVDVPEPEALDQALSKLINWYDVFSKR